MAHKMSSPLMVLRFSVAHLSEASLVMKEMNSLTLSCMQSLASLPILASRGSASFISRVTFAIGRNTSCSLLWGASSSRDGGALSAILFPCFFLNKNAHTKQEGGNLQQTETKGKKRRTRRRACWTEI